MIRSDIEAFDGPVVALRQRMQAIYRRPWSQNGRLYPPWYNYYRSRLLFQLERYDEAAILLEQGTFDSSARHPRDMAWRAACYGYLGRYIDAKRCGEIFIETVAGLWQGDAVAGPTEYVEWLVDVAYYREPHDEERLRKGLRLAALPVR